MSELTSVVERIRLNKKENYEIIGISSEITKRLATLTEKKEMIGGTLREIDIKIDEVSRIQLVQEKFKEMASRNKIIRKLFQIEREIKEIEEKEVHKLKEQKEMTKLKAKIDSLKKKHERISREISQAKQEIIEVDEQCKVIEKDLKKSKKVKTQFKKERREKQEEFDRLNGAVRCIAL
jgi:chromosome segregation ATPase